MTAVQKAEGIMAIQFAQNALGEVLQRLGDDRPQAVADAIHEAVRMLDEARWTIKGVKQT